MDTDSKKPAVVVPIAKSFGTGPARKAASQARSTRIAASEIARARSVPLAVVLEGLGAQPDPKDRNNWRHGASRITVTGDKFHDHNEAGAKDQLEGHSGGGGAIDLVRYLNDVNFREAVRQLGGLDTVRDHVTRQAAPSAVLKPRASDGKVDERPLPQPDAERAARARHYLTAVRAIPPAIVDDALAKGTVFSDARANVVFRLRDEARNEVGYEVRGTHPEKAYHSVHGEKGMFAVKAGDGKTAAFVESGIEALSYQALRADGLVFSTTGGAVNLPLLMAEKLAERGYKLVMAFNADKAGDALAARLTEALLQRGITAVTRDRPDASIGKDWNRQLQAQRSAQQARGQTDAVPTSPARGSPKSASADIDRDAVVAR